MLGACELLSKRLILSLKLLVLELELLRFAHRLRAWRSFLPFLAFALFALFNLLGELECGSLLCRLVVTDLV